MFQFDQNVLLCPRPWATFVSHLPVIATMMAATTNAAATSVLRLSSSRAFLTKLLVLDAGSQTFALKKAVATKVKMKLLKFLLLEFKLVVTGGFYSPNFPKKYPNNLQKPDSVEVEKGRILELQFTAFEIECKYDHLTITDADGTTLMEKSCGSIMPANITSTTNCINILFSSTSIQLYLGDRRNDAMTGFNVSWRSIEPGECQRHNFFFAFVT